MITGNNYIGTKFSANGLETFKTFNPKLNTENKWLFTEATKNEINEACELAWNAFKKFRKVDPLKRAEFLLTIVEEIENLGEILLDTYCTESGLDKTRAVKELTRTLFQLRSFASLLHSNDWLDISIDQADNERKPIRKPDLRKIKIPLGPVAVFGSSNFPFAYSTAGGDTASALAAGCSVIVKSHPLHAGTGELVASAIIAAAIRTKMPEGVFSNLNGRRHFVGSEIVSNPRIKAVGFTGSVQGGRALFDLANSRKEPIPVFAEMGSINPVFISNKALQNNMDHWLKTYTNSITEGAGQFCTNPGLILGIKSPELSDFSRKLACAIESEESGVMLHPEIKTNFDKNKDLVLSQRQVEMLTEIKSELEANYANQTIAMVDGDQFLNNPNLHHEVFGPFSIIVQCSNQSELLEIIESLEGQLTGTLIAEPEEFEAIGPIIDAFQLRVGRMIFNGVPTGVEVCLSMNHGGPYPASTDSRFTAVGNHSIRRWLRSIAYQDFPFVLLPNQLKK